MSFSFNKNRSPRYAQRWMPVRNIDLGKTTIPPYGVMRVTPTSDMGRNTGLQGGFTGDTQLFEATQPVGEDFLRPLGPDPGRLAFNGPTAIKYGSIGECTRDYPVYALAAFNRGESGGGDGLKTIEGSWMLHAGFVTPIFISASYTGFRMPGINSIPDISEAPFKVVFTVDPAAALEVPIASVKSPGIDFQNLVGGQVLSIVGSPPSPVVGYIPGNDYASVSNKPAAVALGAPNAFNAARIPRDGLYRWSFQATVTGGKNSADDIDIPLGDVMGMSTVVVGSALGELTESVPEPSLYRDTGAYRENLFFDTRYTATTTTYSQTLYYSAENISASGIEWYSTGDLVSLMMDANLRARALFWTLSHISPSVH